MGIVAKTRSVIIAGCLGAVMLTTACSPVYRNHGYVPTEEDLAEIVVGVDSRTTVEEVLGAASSASVVSGGDLYYIRSRVRHIGMVRPRVTERQVLAISFDQNDVVQNIERFSLSDGRVVQLTRRVTSSSVEGKGFLRQLLGNIGAFDASQILNN